MQSWEWLQPQVQLQRQVLPRLRLPEQRVLLARLVPPDLRELLRVQRVLQAQLVARPEVLLGRPVQR